MSKLKIMDSIYFNFISYFNFNLFFVLNLGLGDSIILAIFSSPKSYQPIILLNTMGNLFEKMIGECLQFHMISNSFIHPSQLGGLKLRSTTDAGVALTHIICPGWVKNLTTSILVFDIVQFFPSLNHQLLPLIKNHVVTSISHIYSYNKPVVKTIHRAINITTTKAKLFVIYSGINQAVTNSNINHIVIITNSLHAAKRIFDSSVHPY